MQQQPLTGIPVVDVEGFIGLTDWMSASEQPPVRVGWYRTRRIDAPNLCQPQRRYWDGKLFSMPVTEDCDDDEAALLQTKIGVEADRLEWCGLLAPHPEAH